MSRLQALGAVLMRPLQWYNAAAKKNPGTVGIVTTVLKTSAADAFAQKVIERREEIDWRRNAVFTSFGFLYLGCWQFHLYNNLFPRITPSIVSAAGQRSVGPVLTFIDQCVHHPLMYFPVFYMMRGAMAGDAPADSLSRCKEEMWDNLKALWSVWVPAQLVNFSVVPLHLRIPFVAGVSFLWTVILSVLRGALKPPQEQLAAVNAIMDSVAVTAVYADDGEQHAQHLHAQQHEEQAQHGEQQEEKEQPRLGGIEEQRGPCQVVLPVAVAPSTAAMLARAA